MKCKAKMTAFRYENKCKIYLFKKKRVLDNTTP